MGDYGHAPMCMLTKKMQQKTIYQPTFLWEASFSLKKKIVCLFCGILALLDSVNRATVVAQASVARLSVCKFMFLGNRCMDPGQILWATP